MVQFAPGSRVPQLFVWAAIPEAVIELMRSFDVPRFHTSKGILPLIVPCICGGYENETSWNQGISPMGVPALTPTGRFTLKVWLAGLASLLIVMVPEAILPFASDTVRTQEVPDGTVVPQFPHCLASPPPRRTLLMCKSADPAFRRIKAGGLRLILICGEVTGLIFAKKLS